MAEVESKIIFHQVPALAGNIMSADCIQVTQASKSWWKMRRGFQSCQLVKGAIKFLPKVKQTESNEGCLCKTVSQAAQINNGLGNKYCLVHCGMIAAIGGVV